MAKTESTAVNHLIDAVQHKRTLSDPAEDLFAKPKKASSTKVNPPRMTSTIPPMRGAGEVAPLPRTRAAGGTSQHTLPDVPPLPIRSMTAPPSRNSTIPPLDPTFAPTFPQKASSPGLPPAVRGSSAAALPPPTRRSQSFATSSQAAIRPMPKSTLPMPKGTRPPATAPVAAPFETRHPTQPNPFVAVPTQYSQRPPQIDMTGDVVSAENWFEASRAVERFDEETFVGSGPIQVQPQGSLIKKLIVPTIALVLVGVAVGAYIATNNKKHHAAKLQPVAQTTPAITNRTDVTTALPARYAHVDQVPAAAPQPSTESPNAATATAGGSLPEPPPPTTNPNPTPAAAPIAVAAVAAPAPAAVAAPAPAAVAAPAPAAVAAPVAAAAPAAVAAPVAVAVAPVPAAAPVAVAAAAPVAARAPAAAAAPAPARVAAPAPVAVAAAAPSNIREVQTTRGIVKLVDIRIDSKPSGATVMLVDNGKTSFLGSTPIATSLDPKRAYDVVFTLQGRPAQMAHLDPSKTPRLEVVLGKTATAAVVAVPAAPAAAVSAPVHHHHAAPAVQKSTPNAPLAEPSFDAPAPKAEKAEPAVGGNGTLMVSSKPPCEILIDGKPTGLTTPQRALPLSAGAHKITFVNATQNIKKTVAVSITADQTTKLIQDLLK